MLVFLPWNSFDYVIDSSFLLLHHFGIPMVILNLKIDLLEVMSLESLTLI
jgi:hypothetical protein